MPNSHYPCKLTAAQPHLFRSLLLSMLLPFSAGALADTSPKDSDIYSDSPGYIFHVGIGFQFGYGRLDYSQTEKPADIPHTINGYGGLDWQWSPLLYGRARLGAFDVPSYSFGEDEESGKPIMDNHTDQFRGFYLQSSLLWRQGDWFFGISPHYQFKQTLTNQEDRARIRPALGAAISIEWQPGFWAFELEKRWIELTSDEGKHTSGNSWGINVTLRWY